MVALATRYSDDFSQICQKPIAFGPRDDNRWKCPKKGCVKINVDASFIYSSNDSKSSMVGRDSAGKVLFCAISRFNSALSPLHTEFNAILVGLILTEAQHLEVIEVESDFLVGIQEIYKEASDCL